MAIKAEATAEEIANIYKSMCVSVGIINAGKPDNMSQAEWDVHSKVNTDDLKSLVDDPAWTDEDMTAVRLITD